MHRGEEHGGNEWESGVAKIQKGVVLRQQNSSLSVLIWRDVMQVGAAEQRWQMAQITCGYFQLYHSLVGMQENNINPLKPELNRICYLLALLGAHHFLHVSRIRVKLLTLR